MAIAKTKLNDFIDDEVFGSRIFVDIGVLDACTGNGQIVFVTPIHKKKESHLLVEILR
jgi:hypothetical protein